jgi:hypothetical protein
MLLELSGEPLQLSAMLVNNDCPGAIVVVFDPETAANKVVAVRTNAILVPGWYAKALIITHERSSQTGPGTNFISGEMAARGNCMMYTG